MAEIPEVSDYIGYSVPTCILYFKNREQPVMTEEIKSLSIGRNYRGGEYFPDFEVTFVVDRLTFFDIMREKDSLKMLMKVTFFGVSPVEGEEDIRSKERIWFNEKFITYLDDHQYDLMLEEAKLADDIYRTSEEKGKDVAENKEYLIKLNLFKEADVNAAYSVSNAVYTSVDRQTLVAHLLTKVGAKKVIMSPMLPGTISEAITLPITTIGNLKYLEAQHGLHSHGTWFFFDLDYLYILNKKPGCTAWKKGENGYRNIIFTVRKSTDEKKFMGGSRMHSDYNCYVNIDSKNISINSFSSIDSVVSGGDIRTIQHESNTVRSTKVKGQSRSKHVRYLHNKYGNTLAESSMIEDLNDRGLVITLKTYEGNITWMNPNKNFSFTFANQELEKSLGGQYKMLNMFTIITNHGKYFRQETTIQLAKV